MANKNCTCPMAGFCTRHQIEKSQAQYDLCRGVNGRGYKFWAAWETGKFGAVAQDPPMLDEWEDETQSLQHSVTGQRATPQRYLGDHVEQALSKVGITKQRIAKALGGCNCGKRQAKMNAIDQAAREIVGGAVEAGRETIAKLLGG